MYLSVFSEDFKIEFFPYQLGTTWFTPEYCGKASVASLIKLFNPYLDMTKSHSQSLSLVIDKISLTNVSYVPPTDTECSSARHGVRCGRIGNTKDMVTYISKDDLTDILDNVFAKYDIKIASSKQKVIKSTAKKAKSSKVSKSAKTSSVKIDGETLTFEGVIVTKGDTYKKQVAGGKKLHTVVVQVTEEQLELWKDWRKA